MADLMDIAPSTAREVLKIDGARLVVRGLNAPEMAAILARFPDIIVLAAGGNFNVAKLIGQVGQAIGPIIAAGFGQLGKEESEQRASEFSAETQMDLITAIWGLTFPKGLDSFVSKLTALLTGMAPGVGGGAKPIKVRLKPSRSPSQNSSDAASRQIM
jgi:hypothetical protein